MHAASLVLCTCVCCCPWLQYCIVGGYISHRFRLRGHGSTLCPPPIEILCHSSCIGSYSALECRVHDMDGWVCVLHLHAFCTRRESSAYIQAVRCPIVWSNNSREWTQEEGVDFFNWLLSSWFSWALLHEGRKAVRSLFDRNYSRCVYFFRTALSPSLLVLVKLRVLHPALLFFHAFILPFIRRVYEHEYVYLLSVSLREQETSRSIRDLVQKGSKINRRRICSIIMFWRPLHVSYYPAYKNSCY